MLAAVARGWVGYMSSLLLPQAGLGFKWLRSRWPERQEHTEAINHRLDESKNLDPHVVPSPWRRGWCVGGITGGSLGN